MHSISIVRCTLMMCKQENNENPSQKAQEAIKHVQTQQRYSTKK